MTYFDFLNMLVQPIRLFIDFFIRISGYLLSNYFFITFLGIVLLSSLLISFLSFVLSNLSSSRVRNNLSSDDYSSNFFLFGTRELDNDKSGYDIRPELDFYMYPYYRRSVNRDITAAFSSAILNGAIKDSDRFNYWYLTTDNNFDIFINKTTGEQVMSYASDLDDNYWVELLSGSNSQNFHSSFVKSNSAVESFSDTNWNGQKIESVPITQAESEYLDSLLSQFND